jgi:membrane associated rhomboid family serine protease
MGLRKKLFNAAGNFDKQIDDRLKRLPSWVKSALLFVMGLVVGLIEGEVKPRNKVAFALAVLGFGLAVALSVFVFTRPKGRK